MKNIYLIPTDKPSRLIRNNENILKLAIQTLPLDKELGCYPQNIYITSDEEINGFENNIWVYNNDRVWLWKNTMALRSDNKPKKIILTTDQDLIKDGVQVIDDEFLEWFCENSSCEYAEIKKGYRGIDLFNYKIIIPKEKPKAVIKGVTKYTDNGDGTTTLSPADPNFGKIITLKEDLGYTTKMGIDVSDEVVRKIMIPKEYFGEEEPKQETLEEAAESYSISKSNNSSDKYEQYHAFIAGGKWQQKQDINKYSEEEVRDMLFGALNEEKEKCCVTNTTDSIVRKILKQFKKK